MKKFWPLFVIAAGLLLMASGFFYFLFTEFPPDLDPTSAMTARSVRNELISNMLLLFGFGAFVVGIVGCIARFIVRRLRRSSN